MASKNYSTFSQSQKRALLIEGIAELKVNCSDVQLDQLLSYLNMLEHWNKAYNLTAIRDPLEIVSRFIILGVNP